MVEFYDDVTVRPIGDFEIDLERLFAFHEKIVAQKLYCQILGLRLGALEQHPVLRSPIQKNFPVVLFAHQLERLAALDVQSSFRSF